MRVKICCIQNHDEAVMAIRYGATALGLVAAVEGIAGTLDDAGIAAIVARLPPGVTTVLVTTHCQMAPIIAQQQRCRSTAIQLCDRLTDGTYQELRAALPGVPILQVVHVTGEEALYEARLMASQVDGLVLDSGTRLGPRTALGGTGRTHDWHISRQICQAVMVPVWLAGGLNPMNVADAIRRVRPYGVDLCSGVRTDGRLDEKKVRAFFVAVNGASSAPQHTPNQGEHRTLAQEAQDRP